MGFFSSSVREWENTRLWSFDRNVSVCLNSFVLADVIRRWGTKQMLWTQKLDKGDVMRGRQFATSSIRTSAEKRGWRDCFTRLVTTCHSQTWTGKEWKRSWQRAIDPNRNHPWQHQQRHRPPTILETVDLKRASSGGEPSLVGLEKNYDDFSNVDVHLRIQLSACFSSSPSLWKCLCVRLDRNGIDSLCLLWEGGRTPIEIDSFLCFRAGNKLLIE